MLMGLKGKENVHQGDWTVLTEKVAEAEGPRSWNQSVQDSSHGSVICSLYGLGHVSALLLCGLRHGITWELVTHSGSSGLPEVSE